MEDIQRFSNSILDGETEILPGVQAQARRLTSAYQRLSPFVEPPWLSDVQHAAQVVPDIVASSSSNDKLQLGLETLRLFTELQEAKQQMLTMQQQLQAQQKLAQEQSTLDREHMQQQLQAQQLAQEQASQDRAQLQHIITILSQQGTASQPIAIQSQSHSPAPDPHLAPTDMTSTQAPVIIHSQSRSPPNKADSPKKVTQIPSHTASDQPDDKPMVAAAAQSSESQAQIERDLAIIRQAQSRIAALSQPSLTFKVKKPSGSRAAEKRLAAFTGDDEVLQHGSFKCKSEPRSDDETDEVLRELAAPIAAHNMFNPTNKKRTHTNEGYVRGFVEDDHDSEASNSEGSSSAPADDSDATWEPTSSATPSPSRHQQSKSRTDRIPVEDRAAFIAFKAHQAQQLVLSAPESAPKQPSAPEPALDQHGRVPRDTIPEFSIPLPPPEHGEWDDVNHLMKTFLPTYERYKTSCKKGLHDSIWELYKPADKRAIAKFLTRTVHGVVIVKDIPYLQKLTNEDFLQQMCDVKGHSTSALTEIALRKIKLKLPVTERACWIKYEVAWEDCLQLCSTNGEVNAKRLITIYKDGIPDPFFQNALEQKRHTSWREAHAHMLSLLLDNPFIIAWHEDVVTRKQDEPDKRKHTTGGQQQPHGGQAQSGLQGGHAQGGHKKDKTDSPAAAPEVDKSFDPLKYKNSYGISNCNPNFIRDLNLNPSSAPCTRCKVTDHRWTSAMCTSNKDTDGNPLTDLSDEQRAARTSARWNAGFFFKKPIRNAPASSSVQESAAAAANAAKRIQGK